MPHTQARIAFHVTGRVQGVGFRQYTLRRAQDLQLSGWVRNDGDGSVRGEAEGLRSSLEQLVTLLHDGPPLSRVDAVAVVWLEPQRTNHLFRIE